MKRAAALVLCLAFPARADDKTDAREAYERGTAAYQRKDYTAAANEYARADALAPNAVALQAGLDAAVKADDPIIGAELLERAMARRAEGPLAKSIETARAKFNGRAGRIVVVCMDCSATLDGSSITTGALHWTRTGSHAVVLTRGSSVEAKTVDVQADATVEITSAPPPPPPPDPTPTPVPSAAPSPSPKPSSGLSPAFFFIGTGITAGLGIATIAVGADTASNHSAFVRAGCERIDTPDCRKRSQTGLDEQLATNLLLGGTLVAAAATVVSVFFVRWKSPVQPAAALLPNGAWAGVGASF